MTNGMFTSSVENKQSFSANRKGIKAISSRVGQLKAELVVLEKIVKKMLNDKKLTEDEKDTIDLLSAINQNTGHRWVKWQEFKKQLQ